MGGLGGNDASRWRSDWRRHERQPSVDPCVGWRLLPCVVRPQSAFGGLLYIVAVELHQDEVGIHSHLEGVTVEKANSDLRASVTRRLFSGMRLADNLGTRYQRTHAVGPGGDPEGTARGIVLFEPGVPDRASTLRLQADTAEFPLSLASTTA